MSTGSKKSKMEDRLTYNSDGRTLDELVISNAFVHLEQLDDSYFMLIVENTQHHWHLRIGARGSKAYVDAWVYEDNSLIKDTGVEE